MQVTRETTALFVRSPGGTLLPVVNVTCDFCLEMVDATAPAAEWAASRVGGDSANGYELYHVGCLDAELAQDPEVLDALNNHGQ